MAANESSNEVVKIPEKHYIHILDLTTSVERLEIGPKDYIRLDNERVILKPEKMVHILPKQYGIVENPVVRDGEGNVVTDTNGQVKLQYGDQEVRLTQDPFPLWPGELLKDVNQQMILDELTSLHLVATRDFVDENGDNKLAGDKWLFKGPGTYIPRKEVTVQETIKSIVILQNKALRLRAIDDCKDRDGNIRVMGEEWLVRKEGGYVRGVYEEDLGIVDACVLTEKKAVHLKALQTFRDIYGILRKNGEEWLIKSSNSKTHIPDVYEEVVKMVDITILCDREYCIILDPVDDNGRNQLGQKKLVRGVNSFFLHPGERLENGKQVIRLLTSDNGLILQATKKFIDMDEDGNPIERKPGDKWLIRAPAVFVPRLEAEIFRGRIAVKSKSDQGIYVKNLKTGEIRVVKMKTYILNQDEERYEKELSPNIESLIYQDWDPLEPVVTKPEVKKVRDKTRAVVFLVPFRAAVQIHDYKEQKTRVVFGPNFATLGPFEQFTPLRFTNRTSTSQTESLYLPLGPDHINDNIKLKSADNVAFRLRLSYHWEFETRGLSGTEELKLFKIPDFVAHVRNTIAPKIEGIVATSQFGDFKENSGQIIRSAVFGMDENKKMKESLKFKNGLAVNEIEILKFVQIKKKSKLLEATASHEGESSKEEAGGEPERQNIPVEAAMASGSAEVQLTSQGQSTKLSEGILNLRGKKRKHEDDDTDE